MPAFFSRVCGRRVDHHRQVHVVEVAEAEQLGLAAQELELPRPRLLRPATRRRRTPRPAPRRRPRGPPDARRPWRPASPIAAPRSPAIWALWPQACAAPVLGSAIGMPGHDQPVELAEQREGRAVLGALGLGPHAGDGQPALRLQPELVQGLLDEPRGLELLEAQLRIAADVLAERDDALAIAVDGLATARFTSSRDGHGAPYLTNRSGRKGLSNAGVSPSRIHWLMSACGSGRKENAVAVMPGGDEERFDAGPGPKHRQAVGRPRAEAAPGARDGAAADLGHEWRARR